MATYIDKRLFLVIGLMISRIIILVLLHAVVAIDYLNNGDVQNNDRTDDLTEFSQRFHIVTRVFNAYPVVNVSAFVVFEEERISRLHYGDLAVLNATLEPHSDFIIQFRLAPRDNVINSFTDFGFMEAELSSRMDVLIVIGRDSDNPEKPRHRLITSDSRNIETDSTKLYLYNAVWNKDETDSPGLNFYGLFLRVNFDGSESESITQLADNVLRNEGKEINLEPNIAMEIKAFYQNVRSVSDFKLASAVVSLKSYQAAPGNRKYLVAYGDYTANDNSINSGTIALPQMKVLENKFISSAPEMESSSLLIQVISTTSMLVLLYM